MSIPAARPELSELLDAAGALLRQAGDLPQPITASVTTDTAVPAITLKPPTFTPIADSKASIDAIAEALGQQASLHLEAVTSYRVSGLFADIPVLALAVQPQLLPEAWTPFAGVRTTSTGQVADLLAELADWTRHIGTGLITALTVHDKQDHLSVQAFLPGGRKAEAAAAIAAAVPVKADERGWASALLPSGHPLTYNTR